MRFCVALFLFITPLPGIPLQAFSLDSDLSVVQQSFDLGEEEAALLIQRQSDGATFAFGGKRLHQAFSPASTAKIPHTLIALEEGYAQSPDHLFEWDGIPRTFEAWNQNLTLREAFFLSAIWVYQEITRGIGHFLMSQWMEQLSYGNRNIGPPEAITTYWVNGPLEISATEQVHFLSLLVNEELPFSAETFSLAKNIMQEASIGKWKLYGKTGWTGTLGWYVGWVSVEETEAEETYVFAFNMQVRDFDRLPLRKRVVKAALQKLGVAESWEPNTEAPKL